MNILLIDNYDSFTYNLYQLLCELNLGNVAVKLNDQVTLTDLKNDSIDVIIISPGPGNPHNPNDIGNCENIILHSGLPILGVCLGMQCLISSSGGKIREADEPVHGQVDDITHDGSELFDGIPTTFKAMRYHSLIAAELTQAWRICATNPQGIVMAVRHSEKPWWGVQFHPESVASQFGARLLKNFLLLCAKFGHKKTSKTPREFAVNNSTTGISTASKRRWKLLHRLGNWVDPETLFAAMYQHSSFCFWLDSSMLQEGLSRYSIMGDSVGEHAFRCSYSLSQQQWTLWKNNSQSIINQSAFAWIKQFLSEQQLDAALSDLPFKAGLVGWLGYELKIECDAENSYQSKWPDAAWIFPDRYILFDHEKHLVYLVRLLEHDQSDDQANEWFEHTLHTMNNLSTAPDLPIVAISSTNKSLQEIYPSIQKEYTTKVEAARQFIKQGLSYELCLTRRIEVPCSQSGIELYRRLRRRNPAPYASFIRWENLEVLSSSPEQFLKIDASGNVSSKPIKGTIARDANPDRDLANLLHLQNNTKDRAENLMIVDLLRNDLGKVCRTGSVHVAKLLVVESYATVHQLVSQICGVKSPELHMVDCIQAAFPGGSMTGAPKLRSISLLEQLENDFRGIYSGCSGYLSLDNSCDLSINIRHIVLENGVASIGSGGAVVWLSDADDEYQEMCLKAQALLDVLV